MNLINKNSKSPLLAKIKFEPTFFQVFWQFFNPLLAELWASPSLAANSLYFSKFYLFFQNNKQKSRNYRQDTSKNKWRANTNISPK